MARVVWPPDKWDRLTLVAGQVGHGESSVLDVGGRGREMARLLPDAEVVSANIVPPADVIVARGRLPFGDRAFDVVTSCDVIEHMPADRRPAHLSELVRVARHRVVLCCPWGSPEKAESERMLHARLERELGVRADFLEDHLAFGLPTERELRSAIETAAPASTIRARYQQDFEAGDALLMDGMRARHRLDPRALLRYLRRGYLRRAPPPLVATPSAETHRLFLVVDHPAS